MTTARNTPQRFIAAPPDPNRFNQSTRPPERRSVGQAVLSALALLILIAGVPVLLVVLTGPPPVPTGWPTRESLTQPIGIGALITVLTVVVWLAWLHFVVCVIAEFANAVRGRGLPRSIPLGGGSQRLARVLVSALIVTGIAAGQAAAGPGAGGNDVDPMSQVRITHTVAVDHDGTEPPRAQAQDPTRILGSSGEVSGKGDPLAGKKVYVVKAPHGHHHDSLWDIAEKHLADGRRYKEIYELNKDRLQADGQRLELARLIMPGWVLIMPEDATGVERVPLDSVEVGQNDKDKPTKTADKTGDKTGDDGTERPGVDLGGDNSGDGSDRGPGDRGQPDTSPTSTDPRWQLPNDLLGGGLVAAGLLSLLLLERRRRRGVDPGPATAAAEVALRVGADPDRALLLDRALRALVGQCEAAGQGLPPVFAVVAGDQQIDLLLAPPQTDPPAPWQPVDGGRRWRLHRSAVPDDVAGPAPYPALVCLGRDSDGQDLLIDLEAASGAVSIQGDSVVAREVATSVAVQLAINPWGDQLNVTASALPDALGQVLAERLQVVPDIEALVPAFEQGSATTEVLAGRVSRSADDIPQYVVLGAPPGDDAARRLSMLAGRTRAGFGVLVAGPIPGARWQLHVDESGTLRIPALDLVVEAGRLGEVTVGLLTDLLRAARTTGHDPGAGQRAAIPPSGRSGDDASWVTASVRLGVLGPVEVRAGGFLEPERLALATEIVAFLALHPGGVHPSVFGASVWPRGVTPEVRDSAVQRVRDWLGPDSRGDWHLRTDATGRLHLGPEVAVDWECFCELLRRSRTARTPREERELLRRALHLVRGEFLLGRPQSAYAWLARVHLERVVPAMVEDAAHRLAELAFSDDDPAGASAAAQAGLRLAPQAEVVWRDLLLAEYRRAGVPAAEHVVQALGDLVVSLGLTLSAETEALIEELLPARSSRARRVAG